MSAKIAQRDTIVLKLGCLNQLELVLPVFTVSQVLFTTSPMIMLWVVFAQKNVLQMDILV